ncbi:MAG: hypothetical protein ACTS6J_03085 [Burkholderiales bacterium]
MKNAGVSALVLLALGVAGSVQAQGKPDMTFFVTSVNPGKGADLGGLAGADKHCQALAAAVGAGRHTWRAYLSTAASGSTRAVNARDRIGKGPWRNAKGETIARNLEQLHSDNRLTKQTALTEKGEVLNGRGDKPNVHDAITGSQSDGTAFDWSGDTTCGNWTSSGTGSAQVGHIDRKGIRAGVLSEDPAARSWNSSHPSRGCSLDALRSTGGGGLFYCFAAK